MNLIFLDVDGVLTSKKHDKELRDINHEHRIGVHCPLDWNCVENLYELLNSTDANIVLSSGWRRYKEGIKRIKQVLSFYNMEDRYIGEIPYLLKEPKDMEIIKYLNDSLSNNDYHHIVAIDDMCLSEVSMYQVITNRQIGLSKDNVEQAKKILKRRYYN